MNKKEFETAVAEVLNCSLEELEKKIRRAEEGGYSVDVGGEKNETDTRK